MGCEEAVFSSLAMWPPSPALQAAAAAAAAEKEEQEARRVGEEIRAARPLDSVAGSGNGGGKKDKEDAVNRPQKAKKSVSASLQQRAEDSSKPHRSQKKVQPQGRANVCVDGLD